MALDNKQIMTYESLLKVLDYVDERDSMQAVFWNDDVAEIKRVTDRSEETAMNVNGITALVEDVTYTFFGMIPHVTDSSTGRPVFEGYVTAKYINDTGAEVSTQRNIRVEYNGTAYEVVSVKDFAGEVEETANAVSKTTPMSDIRDAIASGKTTFMGLEGFECEIDGVKYRLGGSVPYTNLDKGYPQFRGRGYATTLDYSASMPVDVAVVFVGAGTVGAHYEATATIPTFVETSSAVTKQSTPTEVTDLVASSKLVLMNLSGMSYADTDGATYALSGAIPWNGNDGGHKFSGRALRIPAAGTIPTAKAGGVRVTVQWDETATSTNKWVVKEFIKEDSAVVFVDENNTYVEVAEYLDNGMTPIVRVEGYEVDYGAYKKTYSGHLEFYQIEDSTPEKARVEFRGILAENGSGEMYRASAMYEVNYGYRLNIDPNNDKVPFDALKYVRINIHEFTDGSYECHISDRDPSLPAPTLQDVWSRLEGSENNHTVWIYYTKDGESNECIFQYTGKERYTKDDHTFVVQSGIDGSHVLSVIADYHDGTEDYKVKVVELGGAETANGVKYTDSYGDVRDAIETATVTHMNVNGLDSGLSYVDDEGNARPLYLEGELPLISEGYPHIRFGGITYAINSSQDDESRIKVSTTVEYDGTQWKAYCKRMSSPTSVGERFNIGLRKLIDSSNQIYYEVYELDDSDDTLADVFEYALNHKDAQVGVWTPNEWHDFEPIEKYVDHVDCISRVIETGSPSSPERVILTPITTSPFIIDQPTGLVVYHRRSVELFGYIIISKEDGSYGARYVPPRRLGQETEPVFYVTANSNTGKVVIDATPDGVGGNMDDFWRYMVTHKGSVRLIVSGGGAPVGFQSVWCTSWSLSSNNNRQAYFTWHTGYTDEIAKAGNKPQRNPYLTNGYTIYVDEQLGVNELTFKELHEETPVIKVETQADTDVCKLNYPATWEEVWDIIEVWKSNVRMEITDTAGLCGNTKEAYHAWIGEYTPAPAGTAGYCESAKFPFKTADAVDGAREWQTFVVEGSITIRSNPFTIRRVDRQINKAELTVTKTYAGEVPTYTVVDDGEGTFKKIFENVYTKDKRFTVNVVGDGADDDEYRVQAKAVALYGNKVRLISQYGGKLSFEPAGRGLQEEMFGVLDILRDETNHTYSATYTPVAGIDISIKHHMAGLIVERTGADPNYSYIVTSDESLEGALKDIVEKVLNGRWNVYVRVDGMDTTKVYQSPTPNAVAHLLNDGTGTDTNVRVRLYSQIGTKLQFGDAEFEDFGILDIVRDAGGAYTATYTPVSISGGGGGGIDMTTVKAYVDPKFENKVDKVTGKDLSANDFTDILKTKLDGIEEEAQKNVQSDWNATSGDSFIKNKPDVYTQDEIDDFLDDIYTKTEVDTKLGDYYKKTETYNKTEVDTKFGDYYKKTETYNKTEVDAELAKKVDKTLDDYLTKAELITDGIKITPNKGSAIEYKLDKYVEKAEMTSENLVKITQHDGTTVEQKPYLAKVETIQVDGLDEYKITDNKGVETKLDVYKRADTFGRDEDAVPTDLVTYGKKQIDDMIKALEGVTMKVVATVPAPADATAGTIYICDGTMYLCYKNGTGESAPKVITPIGGTAPDLTQYWKKTDGDLMSTAEHTKLTQDYTKAEVDAKFVQLEDPDYKNPDDYLEKVELVNNRLKITPHGGTAVTQQPFIMEVIKNEDVYDFKESNNNVVTIDITTAVTSELEAWIDTVLV